MGGIVEDGVIETTREVTLETESSKESNCLDEAHAVELVALSIVDANISTPVDNVSVALSDANRVTVALADDYDGVEEINDAEFGQYISDDGVGNMKIVEEDTRPFFSPGTQGHCPQEIIKNHRKYLLKLSLKE